MVGSTRMAGSFSDMVSALLSRGWKEALRRSIVSRRTNCSLTYGRFECYICYDVPMKAIGQGNTNRSQQHAPHRMFTNRVWHAAQTPHVAISDPLKRGA